MKVRVSILIALMALSAPVLAACGPAAGSEKPDLEGKPWKLLSYMTAKNGAVDVLPGTEITTLFNQGQISGSASCNRYGGTYTVSGEKLMVNSGATTMMYCAPDEVMAREYELRLPSPQPLRGR